MPVYEHKCDSCEYEWEDLFKLGDPIPSKCPKCGKKKIRRLMSWSSGRVELTGLEFKAKLKEDVLKTTKEVYSDENKMANLIGEDKYHANEVAKAKFKL